MTLKEYIELLKDYPEDIEIVTDSGFEDDTFLPTHASEIIMFMGRKNKQGFIENAIGQQAGDTWYLIA